MRKILLLPLLSFVLVLGCGRPKKPAWERYAIREGIPKELRTEQYIRDYARSHGPALRETGLR